MAKFSIENEEIFWKRPTFWVYGLWAVMSLWLVLQVAWLTGDTPLGPYNDDWGAFLSRFSFFSDASVFSKAGTEGHWNPILFCIAPLSWQFFGDLRLFVYLSLVLNILTALGLIWGCGEFRGRCSWLDMFFPLTFLSGAQILKFLWPAQMFMPYATCLSCWVILFLLLDYKKHRKWLTVIGCMAILLLPMLGNAGLVLSPFLIGNVFFYGVWLRIYKQRFHWFILLSSVLAAIFYCVAVGISTRSPGLSMVVPEIGSYAYSITGLIANSIRYSSMAYGSQGIAMAEEFGMVNVLTSLFLWVIAIYLFCKKKFLAWELFLFTAMLATVWLVPFSLALKRMGWMNDWYATPLLLIIICHYLWSAFLGERSDGKLKITLFCIQALLLSFFVWTAGEYCQEGIAFCRTIKKNNLELQTAGEKGYPFEAVADQKTFYPCLPENRVQIMRVLKEKGFRPWTQLQELEECLYVRETYPLEHVIIQNGEKIDGKSLCVRTAEKGYTLLRIPFSRNRVVKCIRFHFSGVRGLSSESDCQFWGIWNLEKESQNLYPDKSRKAFQITPKYRNPTFWIDSDVEEVMVKCDTSRQCEFEIESMDIYYEK